MQARQISFAEHDAFRRPESRGVTSALQRRTSRRLRGPCLIVRWILRCAQDDGDERGGYSARPVGPRRSFARFMMLILDFIL